MAVTKFNMDAQLKKAARGGLTNPESGFLLQLIADDYLRLRNEEKEASDVARLFALFRLEDPRP